MRGCRLWRPLISSSTSWAWAASAFDITPSILNHNGVDNQTDNQHGIIGYLPAKDPRYAFAVAVQHGGDPTRSVGPIARKIIEESLALDHGYEVPLQAVEEAWGNFEHYSYISFGSNEKMDDSFEDMDTGSQVELAGLMPVKKVAPRARPHGRRW